ncbi:hypothetical protein Lser_V15G20492 [Lactuca serriola]
MSGREDSDSDAPEEFTAEQAIQKDEEIRSIQIENKARILREVKERRRKWAEKLTPRVKNKNSIQEDTEEIETQEKKGMLPDDIVKLLAANEKKVFSDSEEEKSEKKPRKKKSKHSGMEPIILKEIPPPPCLQKSLEFLKKRKMQVSRSSAVLDNSHRALRLISASGVLNKK